MKDTPEQANRGRPERPALHSHNAWVSATREERPNSGKGRTSRPHGARGFSPSLISQMPSFLQPTDKSITEVLEDALALSIYCEEEGNSSQ